MSKKKIRIIDLFAGCGGLADGFEQSGNYEMIAAIDWEKEPCNTLRERLKSKWKINDADRRVICYDIQKTKELISGVYNKSMFEKFTGLDFLVKEFGDVDVVIGGPPCQAYSLAGRIRDENGMHFDYRNYLFESYLKIVNHYNPKIILFENVPGILSAKPGGVSIIDRIRNEFDKSGYVLSTNLRNDALFDLSHFGIPQKRKRVIIVGLKKNYFKRPSEQISKFYSEIIGKHWKNEQKTVNDAIGDLPKLMPSKKIQRINGKKYSHSLIPTDIPNHIPRCHSQRDIDIFWTLAHDIETKQYKYVSIKALHALYTAKTGKESNIHKYYVLRWKEPSNTIPAHLFKDGLRHIHPDSEQARSITVREAARLQTFDDNYVFTGSMTDQYKMVGNAVPPLFAKTLANAIFELYEDNMH
ncbi:DNA cytosine methyltransferase [bacterium]|nr:DNA cytosine methyltransferase [bacterium]